MQRSRNFFMCNGAQFSRPSWDQLQVAVEFHAYAKAFFQSTVVPRLGELRTLYEGAGGTVVVMTLLREPVSHLISVYQMWPPVRPYESERNRLPTLDFAAWARGTAGVQVAALGAQNLLRRFAPRPILGGGGGSRVSAQFGRSFQPNRAKVCPSTVVRCTVQT